jgi:hypothetical protein
LWVLFVSVYFCLICTLFYFSVFAFLFIFGAFSVCSFRISFVLQLGWNSFAVLQRFWRSIYFWESPFLHLGLDIFGGPFSVCLSILFLLVHSVFVCLTPIFLFFRSVHRNRALANLRIRTLCFFPNTQNRCKTAKEFQPICKTKLYFQTLKIFCCGVVLFGSPAISGRFCQWCHRSVCSPPVPQTRPPRTETDRNGPNGHSTKCRPRPVSPHNSVLFFEAKNKKKIKKNKW